jgi:hypothetical protein
MLFSAREHLASHWARSGRRPAAPRSPEPQWRRRDFLPLGFAHSSRGKKVSPPPILRCAAARAGAASIAFGFQIAIEAAVAAELENSKEK